MAQDVETSNLGCAPQAVSEFMTDRRKKNGFACQVCKFEERGSRLMTVAICTQHCLRLCIRSHERKTIRNKDGEEISDYSWMAPDDSMNCWEKAHTFYIPKGLFSAGESIKNVNEKLKFGNVALSSECYLAKRRALGLAPTNRGGRRVNGQPSMS